jgi:hypothetical protein
MHYEGNLMLFSVFRDFSSIQFVRCWAQLPNKDFGVGGCAFDLKTAVAKCRSEYAERLYQTQVLHSLGLVPLGIAAHPTEALKAQESAIFEAKEELVLQKLKTTGEFQGRILLNFKNFTLGVGQLSGSGYIALLRARCQKKPMLFYSARRTLIQTLLKVWEEYRNPFFYNPSEELLKKYSKSSKLFSDQENSCSEIPAIKRSFHRFENQP